MHAILALLLCTAAAAAISGAAADDRVVTYSAPAFNTTTTAVELLGTTNSSIYSFNPGHDYGKLERTEGFLLLEQPVGIWRAGAGEQPALEASINTSFRYSGRAAKPIAFVVLLDSIPLGGSLRGEANYTASTSDATGGIAVVQVGPVMSYRDPDVGLNITITPRGAAALAVWIQYDAGRHCLSVYVAAAGKPKPSKALLDAPLDLFSGRGTTTETAYIGFFADMVHDVIVGVRNWILTVDKIPGNDEESVRNGIGKKGGRSWLLILLAVLGSVVTTSAII